MIVVAQLLLEAINAPAPSCSSNVGLAKALGTPYWVSSGPIARIITLFGLRPLNNEAPNHDVVARLHKGACADVTQLRSWRAVSSTSVQIPSCTAPDDHFIAGPDCGVTDSRGGRVGITGGCPTVDIRIISPPVFRELRDSGSTPDDHFVSSPHCRVTESGQGARVVLVAVQLFVAGLYLPPVLDRV